MTTIGEAIDKAIRENNGALAGAVVDRCIMFRMNYNQIFAVAKRRNPGLTLAEWDALMYEADRAASDAP